MSVELLTDYQVSPGSGMTAMYDDTDMWAFGPVFDDPEEAQDFLAWLPEDPRRLDKATLEIKHDVWWRASRNPKTGEFTPIASED